MEDPTYIRWKQKYPKFPGVEKCLELLRRHNVRGSMIDILCFELESNAPAHSAEIIAAFRREEIDWVRVLILHAICDAKLHDALPLLVESLSSGDDRIRDISADGLKALNTPESRKALWEAGLKK